MRRTKRFSSPSPLCDIHPSPIHLSQRGGTELFLQSDLGVSEKELDSRRFHRLEGTFLARTRFCLGEMPPVGIRTGSGWGPDGPSAAEADSSTLIGSAVRSPREGCDSLERNRKVRDPMLQLIFEFVEGFLHRPPVDEAAGFLGVAGVMKRRMREVGARKPSDHVLFPPPHSVHRGLLWTQEDPRFGGQCRIGDVSDEIPNHVVPDVGKGSYHAPDVPEGRKFPTALTLHPLWLPFGVDEKNHPVRLSSQHLGQVQVRVDDAFHTAHVGLEMPQRLLDWRTKVKESGPGHSGGFGEDRFLGMSELTESPKSGSEGSGRRFEHAAEIFLGERLGVPEPRMAVDESVMQRRRRLPEIGCDIESRLLEILIRVYLPIQGAMPTVAEPREQVVRLDVLGRHPKDEAVPPTSECGLPEKSGHVREPTGMEPSQDVGLPIPRVEKLVRLQNNVSRAGRDPKHDVRGVPARNRRCPSKGTNPFPVEIQGVPGLGRNLRRPSERVHHETREALPTLGLHHIEPVALRLELERGRIESGRRDGEREVDGPCARVRIRRLQEKEDDRLDSRFREEGTIFHGKPRRPADRVAAPAEGPQPCPHRTGGTQRPVRGCDRVVESRGHHVNDRYNSRVLAAIRSHVKFRRTCRRPAFPIFAPVWGSSKIRVIARPSFAGSPGGTSSPVSSFTTTSLMPPTRVATTGVSQAIASRLMIPNGS